MLSSSHDPLKIFKMLVARVVVTRNYHNLVSLFAGNLGQFAVINKSVMKSIMSSFTGAGRNRNSASESKTDYNRTNSSGTPGNLRGMDEKLFNTCVDLLEVFAKKASAEVSFAGDLVAVNHASREVDSVVASVLGGMASKRFLESNPSAVLWVSLLKVLESIPALFSAEQCGELRDGSEDGMALLGTEHHHLLCLCTVVRLCFVACR